MCDIIHKKLCDVVSMAVALQDDHPEGTILVDLAVRAEGIGRVRHAYGDIDFVPLSNDDPIIKKQSAGSLEYKRADGYVHIYGKYLQTFARVYGNNVSKPTKDWFSENMDNLQRRIVSEGVYF